MLAKMGASKPGDDDIAKEYGAADKRLFLLFEKKWRAGGRSLFCCYLGVQEAAGVLIRGGDLICTSYRLDGDYQEGDQSRDKQD